MDPVECIQKQIERGVEILHRLNDLEEVVSGKYSLRVKIFPGQKFYDEQEIEQLETIVRNWQTETITCLDLLVLEKENFISTLQSTYSIIDKREDLALDIKHSLKFLKSLIQKLKKQEHSHFPIHKTRNEGERVYIFLTKGCYMQGHLDSWLFLMGFIEQKPPKVKKIKWLTTKEQLNQMLRMINKDLIGSKSIKIADIKRLTPEIFIDKDSKPLKLAKSKQESSLKMDELIKFFRPSPTTPETL